MYKLYYFGLCFACLNQMFCLIYFYITFFKRNTFSSNKFKFKYATYDTCCVSCSLISIFVKTNAGMHANRILLCAK